MMWQWMRKKYLFYIFILSISTLFWIIIAYISVPAAQENQKWHLNFTTCLFHSSYYFDIWTLQPENPKQRNSKTLQATQHSTIINVDRKLSASSVFIRNLPSMTAHPIVLQSHIIIFTANIKLLQLPSNTNGTNFGPFIWS